MPLLSRRTSLYRALGSCGLGSLYRAETCVSCTQYGHWDGCTNVSRKKCKLWTTVCSKRDCSRDQNGCQPNKTTIGMVTGCFGAPSFHCSTSHRPSSLPGSCIQYNGLGYRDSHVFSKCSATLAAVVLSTRTTSTRLVTISIMVKA